VRLWGGGLRQRSRAPAACRGSAPCQRRGGHFLGASHCPPRKPVQTAAAVPTIKLNFPEDSLSEGPGAKIGRYKLIKPGMDTQQVVARFEAERQALAMRIIRTAKKFCLP